MILWKENVKVTCNQYCKFYIIKINSDSLFAYLVQFTRAYPIFWEEGIHCVLVLWFVISSMPCLLRWGLWVSGLSLNHH